VHVLHSLRNAKNVTYSARSITTTGDSFMWETTAAISQLPEFFTEFSESGSLGGKPDRRGIARGLRRNSGSFSWADLVRYPR